MPSKNATFKAGDRLSAQDMNMIVQRVINSLVGGRGNNVTRSSKQIAVSQSGHPIIPIGDGGSNIKNAIDKAALDLIIVPAPALGWVEQTQTLYERSEDGLSWLIVNRWREFTG